MTRTPRRRRSTAAAVRRAVQPVVQRRPFTELLERRVMLAAVDVLTYRNDFGNTGQNLGETTLTPAVVGNAAQFGKRFTTTLDGQVVRLIKRASRSRCLVLDYTAGAGPVAPAAPRVPGRGGPPSVRPPA